jgi:hypothetical protein
MTMRVRLLVLLAVVAMVAAVVAVVLTGMLSAPNKGPTAADGTGARSSPAMAQPALPGPLHGVPLAGSSGLRLLVSAGPPFVLNVDAGAVRPITGLNVRGNPVLSVLAVGQDAVLWLDRCPHATTAATRSSSGSQPERLRQRA